MLGHSQATEIVFTDQLGWLIDVNDDLLGTFDATDEAYNVSGVCSVVEAVGQHLKIIY
jgi:hypothetical protein